jgi:hypothetical protein
MAQEVMDPLIPGQFLTTAMGILPHAEVEPALDLALSLDIPFWPQLPNLSFYEDMYVQAGDHFPGILLFPQDKNIRFDTARFYEKLPQLLEDWEDLRSFDMSSQCSLVYDRFLELDLSGYVAIRGQLEGPISFGLKILDENNIPIIFHDEVRPILMDFLARRAQAQLTRLKEKHPRAFLFIDEPGLQFIFSAVSGYPDSRAREDLDRFLAQIDRPRGIHLCGNPDWDFLLNRDLDILSLDIYTNGEVFHLYGKAIRRFLERGGVLAWGLIPTSTEDFQQETTERLLAYLETLWPQLLAAGIDREQLFAQSLLAPATCCLINPDREKTVAKAYSWLRDISRRLREKYRLG